MQVARNRLNEASRIMLDFAERTGVAGGVPRRYLWTDAFAVSNFLGLARVTGEERFLKLALELVSQVHDVLGRHRTDDARRGWISGMSAEEGARHPTQGGLRIGKRLPERGPRETFDEQLEWERDGQYFHYLTRWMRALDLVARATNDGSFNAWARELAAKAHEAFVYGSDTHGGRRMFWKMSIDLSRPLVPSMGHHDPLDGFVTFSELEHTAASIAGTAVGTSHGPNLQRAIVDFRSMVHHARDLSTVDPLGLGGLLVDAYRVARLTSLGSMQDDSLLEVLLGSALEGLYALTERRVFDASGSQRVAFRELGLTLGLQAVPFIEAEVDAHPSRFVRSVETHSRLHGLARYGTLAQDILSFWLLPEHRRPPSYTGHLDINEVMLATCLLPIGYLIDESDEHRLGVRVAG
jgi:hypothetical protein